ncbi:hypothetical protein [Novosphingobium sp.]|uniref:hypothetical protein n=1 Tax=Novosphingobium sp. TaxID=1874826 RepID=UPI003BA9E608
MRQSPARMLVVALAALAFPLAAPISAQGQATTGVGSQFELTYWQSVESGNDPALYEAYLAQYPNGTFAAVARVKLVKLRPLAASAPASAPAPAPAPAPVPAPAQVVPTPQPAPPVVTAMAAPPAPTPTPAPAPAPKQLAAAKAARSAPPSAPIVATRSAAESAPYVTAAEPADPEPESSDSAALRRLLGALGDSQRLGAPSPAPIVEVAEGGPAPDTALLAPAAAPLAVPGAAPSRLVEVAGPPVAVPDAAALSASAAPAGDPRPIAVGPLPAGFVLPSRPQLAAIPPLAFPASFCSAEARNAFHDQTYVTAVEASKRNNDATIAYMHQLQDLYDTNQLSGDINPMNAVAAEARAYGPVAAAAFTAQSALVSAFNTLMAVPIRACEAAKQP